MRAVIQRVSSAACRVEGEITGKIGKGLVVLLGVEPDDSKEDLEWLVGKIRQMRIFSDEQGRMNNSVTDISGEILLISQFTLMAQTKKGNRPSFIKAAAPQYAQELYQMTIQEFHQQMNQRPQTGIFGADMKIDIQADGPVTIIMNTKDKDNF